MFAWFLNLAYLALLAIVSPWLIFQSLRNGKYSEGWSERLFGRVPRRESGRRCVWLHAVSLGEVNLLQTVVQRIETEYPDWDVVISSTTATGYAQAKKRYAPRPVFYAPLDFSWAVKNALRRLQPDLLLLAELEVWPNLIKTANRLGVPVAVINGRLGEKSHRGYGRMRWLVQSTFARLDLVAAQTEEYAQRFCDLGCLPEHVHVTGSLKFDGAQADRKNSATVRLAHLAGIQANDVVFLAGSTQAGEEAVALEVFQRYANAHPQLKLILVPRHPERFTEVVQLLDRRGIAWQRRSELDGVAQVALQPGSSRGISENVTTQDNADSRFQPQPDASGCGPFANKRGYSRILLVDAVGELAAWWGLTQIAFVGGSLGNRGGQNMIEPASYGAAVCFGPNTWNFRDVVALLLNSDAAVVVRNQTDLQQFVGRCLSDRTYREQLGQRAADIVRQQQGATEQTMKLLRSFIDPPSAAVVRRIGAPKPARPGSSAAPSTKRRAV